MRLFYYDLMLVFVALTSEKKGTFYMNITRSLLKMQELALAKTFGIK